MPHPTAYALGMNTSTSGNPYTNPRLIWEDDAPLLTWEGKADLEAEEYYDC